MPASHCCVCWCLVTHSRLCCYRCNIKQFFFFNLKRKRRVALVMRKLCEVYHLGWQFLLQFNDYCHCAWCLCAQKFNVAGYRYCLRHINCGDRAKVGVTWRPLIGQRFLKHGGANCPCYSYGNVEERFCNLVPSCWICFCLFETLLEIHTTNI